MKVTVTKQPKSKVQITVGVPEDVISDVKRSVMNQLRPRVKASGFRAGHAPDKVVEKELGPQAVQAEVLEAAVNRAYGMAVSKEDIKIVGQPQIEVKKFVPYTDLEFTATVEVVPEFKLPDYKKLKATKQEPKVEAADVNEVIGNLQTRLAESKEVTRAAKDGDKVWIDFEGKTTAGKPVEGAKGEDYPLVIGSNTFIKGFEPEMLGKKAGDEHEFTVKFPDDYHAKNLQGKPVTFAVKVKKVEEVVKPKADDEFAAKVGPFKSLKELKDDIKKQLAAEKQEQVDRQFREDLVGELVDKSKFDVPEEMLERVKTELRQELLQNLQYRGLTFEQYLQSEGISEADFEKTHLVERATRRSKASIILTELAEAEKVKIPREELDARLDMLKKQYTDPKMQEELDKPEARRELAAQMLTEKTIDMLQKANS